MRNRYILRVMETMSLVLLICSSVSCVTWSEFSPERIDKIDEEDRKREVWYEKYIEDVLFIGMFEEEFARLFAKNENWNDSQRPYITDHKKNIYFVIGLKGEKYRITFENGLLAKFEIFGWEKIPFITATYRDYTHLLRGYKYRGSGFYKGMSEGTFLKKFSNQIILRLKNGYVVLMVDGHKYGAEFTDGILTHSWR